MATCNYLNAVLIAVSLAIYSFLVACLVLLPRIASSAGSDATAFLGWGSLDCGSLTDRLSSMATTCSRAVLCLQARFASFCCGGGWTPCVAKAFQGVTWRRYQSLLVKLGLN